MIKQHIDNLVKKYSSNIMIDNLQSELREHLDSKESLLWTGKPKLGIVFRTYDFFMIPFSVFWCAFAVFWVILASQGSWIFALFGLPFVIIGLFFVFGRFMIDAKQRQNTVYGLTENRIIIKSGIFSKSIKSLNIRTLSDIELSEKGGGIGTISLGPKNPFMPWGDGMGWWPGMKSSPKFEMITNARKVYNQIIAIQNSK